MVYQAISYCSDHRCSFLKGCPDQLIWTNLMILLFLLVFVSDFSAFLTNIRTSLVLFFTDWYQQLQMKMPHRINSRPFISWFVCELKCKNTHLPLERLNSLLSNYLWSLRRIDYKYKCLYFSTPFIQFRYKCPKIKAELKLKQKILKYYELNSLFF